MSGLKLLYMHFPFLPFYPQHSFYPYVQKNFENHSKPFHLWFLHITHTTNIHLRWNSFLFHPLPHPLSWATNSSPFLPLSFSFPHSLSGHVGRSTERVSGALSSAWSLGSLSEPVRHRWVKILTLYSSHSTWLYSPDWKTDCHIFV